MIRKFLLIIIGLVCGIIIWIIILEIYCRQTNKFDLQRYQYQDQLGSESYSEVPRFRPTRDLFLCWEHNPNFNCYSPTGYQLNSYGNFDEEYPVKKDAKIYRILVLGDSISEWGWYIEYLKELLNQGNLGYKFEVWNCGVGGYNVKQYYYYLKLKGVKFNPDMVIISLCLNDFSEDPVMTIDQDGKYIFYNNSFESPTFSINRSLFLKSHAYRFFTFTIESLFIDKDIIAKSSSKEEERGEWAMTKILEITQKRNIQLLPVIIPYFKSEYNDHEKELWDIIKKVLEKYKIRYVDLHGSFKNIDDFSWRIYPQDYVHPSKKAHKVMAEKIYVYLIKNLRK